MVKDYTTVSFFGRETYPAVTWWSMTEMLEASYALAQVFKWTREEKAGFDIVYGINTTDFAGVQVDYIMVGRDFCDRFHNPRHLPVIPTKVKWQHDTVAVYQKVREFTNGRELFLPMTWWDKQKQSVDSFVTNHAAQAQREFLHSLGHTVLSVVWNDTDRTWDVTYLVHPNSGGFC